MRRIVGMALILAATAAIALAQGVAAPEIDAGVATVALAEASNEFLGSAE